MHGTSQRTRVANRVRQLHQLDANQRHVHLIESSTVRARGLDSGWRRHSAVVLLVTTRRQLATQMRQAPPLSPIGDS
eukprot:1143509-Pelagomonas_calceolata.AAC.1